MKSNSSVDKGKADKAKPQEVKLSGNIVLRAKKGCMLPIRYADPGLVRITDAKDVALDWGSLPYESKIMIRRSLKQGHVILKGDK